MSSSLRDWRWQGIGGHRGEGRTSMAEPGDGSQGFDLEEAHVTFTHVSLAKTTHMAKPSAEGWIGTPLTQGWEAHTLNNNTLY